MSDFHLTQLILTARAEGEITDQEYHSLLLDHLQALCPHCQEELQRYSSSRRTHLPSIAFKDLMAGLISSLGAHQEDIEQRHREAEQWADELEAWSHDERLAKQSRALRRFRGPVFALVCIKRARAALPADHERSRQWAYLGQMATMHPECETYPELEALALAYQSNARRVAGAFESAQTLMEMARNHMRRQGVTDLAATARVFSLEASLWINLRDFRQAKVLLRRAELLYRITHQPIERIRVLLKQGTCNSYSGNTEQAFAATQEALRSLPANSDPHLTLCARHNHAIYLCALDRYDEAEALLQDGMHLYEAFPDDATQALLSWLKGRIAFGHGALDAAERLFEETRASYQHQKQPYDAALVSLDLALVYAEQLRTDELRALTDEMVHTFTRYELHHEAVAALILLKQTVYAERALTVTTVRRLARFLEQERSHLRPRKRPER